MQHHLSPFSAPKLRADLPIYPPSLQALRVTGGTIPGPSGYMSSSVLGPSLYIAFTQQLDPTTLLPRDREPCLVLDLNRTGLSPGYYTGRLAGTFQSLPLYEVGGATITPALALSPLAGLTPAQTEALSTLSPAQLATLSNLNQCQLQTLLTALPTSQLHTITSGVLTPTQISNLITWSTSTQLLALYSQLTTSQLITLTTALNQPQIQTLITALTPQEIQSALVSLSTTQLQTIATLPPASLDYLFSNLTILEIQSALNVLTTAQIQTLLGLDAATVTFLITNLTPSQLQSTFTNLTTDEINILFSLTGAQIHQLVTNLTPAQISTFLAVDPLPSSIPGTVNAQTGTSYTFTAADHSTLVTFSNASSIAGSLPNPATVGEGWQTTLWVLDGAGTLTLTPAAGTIDGASTFQLTAGTGTTVISDGTNYQIASGGAGVTGIGGSSRTEGTLAATGSVQGDAAAITTDAVVVTGADGTKGVILPNTAGAIIALENDSASTLIVYPPSGASIESGGANNPVSALGNTLYLFVRYSSTQWGWEGYGPNS